MVTIYRSIRGSLLVNFQASSKATSLYLLFLYIQLISMKNFISITKLYLYIKQPLYLYSLGLAKFIAKNIIIIIIIIAIYFNDFISNNFCSAICF